MRLMRFFLCALVLSLLLSACEESVSPILESDQQFTIFGTLDMDQDTQFVRVIPIRPTLVADAGAPLDVTFTSTDLIDGQRLAWRDSTVQFADGTVGHVFYAPVRVRPGHTYRIEIQPSGSSIITSAETTVPAQPEAVIMPEVLQIVFTTQVRARQQILWEGLDEEPFSIEQWYRFFSIEDFSFRDVQLPYVPLNGLAEGQADVWEMDLNLVRDRDTLSTMIDLNASTALAGLGMTITLLDDAFAPPGGEFDPDVLAQPGTLSNVENGFGFIGSVGRFSVEWLLADTTARALRYIPLGTALREDAAEMLKGLKQETAIGNRR